MSLRMEAMTSSSTLPRREGQGRLRGEGHGGRGLVDHDGWRLRPILPDVEPDHRDQVAEVHDDLLDRRPRVPAEDAGQEAADLALLGEPMNAGQVVDAVEVPRPEVAGP